MNELFLYLHEKFNILLLESEMEEVLKICKKIIEVRKESERRSAEQELKDKKLKNNNFSVSVQNKKQKYEQTSDGNKRRLEHRYYK